MAAGIPVIVGRVLGQDGGGISHILIRRELHPRHDPVPSIPLSFLRSKTIAEVLIESVRAYLDRGIKHGQPKTYLTFIF